MTLEMSILQFGRRTAELYFYQISHNPLWIGTRGRRVSATLHLIEAPHG